MTPKTTQNKSYTFKKGRVHSEELIADFLPTPAEEHEIPSYEIHRFTGERFGGNARRGVDFRCVKRLHKKQK